jgi:hypothetical protein
MHDFGDIVYLDLQKTGSTFVSEFLRFACVCPERKFQKHGWITDDLRSSATYFITVRHPHALYSSLYRYGLDRKGAIYNRLHRAGQLYAYESLESFAQFLLDPDNSLTLHPQYSKYVASEIGFMSYRYLLLSLQNPLKKVVACVAEGGRVSELMKESIVDLFLKNEALNLDLSRLSTELLPQYFDPGRAGEFLNRAPRINQSTTESAGLTLRSGELLKIIASKEALLMQHYH